MPRYLKELPATNRGKYPRGPYPEHVKMIKAMQRKPGVWVPVKSFSHAQNASTFARKIRERQFIAFKDGGPYEAQARGKVVYARVVE